MCTKNRLWPFALALLATACWRADHGAEESCNYKDDNRDGRVDDGFRDAAGRYDQVTHCGRCGVDCAKVFPTAAQVTCALSAEGERACAIAACPADTQLVDASICTPLGDVLCLPCLADQDCAAAAPEAVCLNTTTAMGHCAAPCAADAPCPNGFSCEPGSTGAHCVPRSGTCDCTPLHQDQVFGCWVVDPRGSRQCAGSQTCRGDALDSCTALEQERCDGEDNNCNGQTDESFVIDGVYATDAHCGGCNHPCLPRGENMAARCVVRSGKAACIEECEGGYVDLDGSPVNGCECWKTSSVFPPLALGGDMDCDGEIDGLEPFVFVSKSGVDTDPGTLERPVLTIGRGLALALGAQKTVLVSQGSYDERVTLQPGVSLFGGYRADFGNRDLVLYETVIEHSSGAGGLPALVAHGITASTEVAGFVVIGTDADTTGGGATAVQLLGCSSALYLHDLRVEAGRGADGSAGRSSAELLVAHFGLMPAELDGTSGGTGRAGVPARSTECRGLLVAGGARADKRCPLALSDVSGGRGGDAVCPDTGCKLDAQCPNAGCSDYMQGDVCDLDAVLRGAVPNPRAEDGSGSGAGVAGEVSYDAPTNRPGSNFCDDNPTLRREGDAGGNGRPGADGAKGFGCDLPHGIFDVKSALWGAGSGGDGGAGSDGGGGGGGTAGNGYDALSDANTGNVDHTGGSGGGGGSGGCGVNGATGGGGGGSSIGVVVSLTLAGDGPQLASVRIIPGAAGLGGAGGPGAAGGSSGAGGLGGDGAFWCARQGGKGGDGGHGGAGGGGGGGCGGSISGFHVIAQDNDAGRDYADRLAVSNSVDPLPAAGSAGQGGFSPGASGTSGVAGTAEAFRVFDN